MNVLKILGIVATIGGAACTMLSEWVSDKKTDKMIEDKINEKLANK